MIPCQLFAEPPGQPYFLLHLYCHTICFPKYLESWWDTETLVSDLLSVEFELTPFTLILHYVLLILPGFSLTFPQFLIFACTHTQGLVREAINIPSVGCGSTQRKPTHSHRESEQRFRFEPGFLALRGSDSASCNIVPPVNSLSKLTAESTSIKLPRFPANVFHIITIHRIKKDLPHAMPGY